MSLTEDMAEGSPTQGDGGANQTGGAAGSTPTSGTGGSSIGAGGTGPQGGSGTAGSGGQGPPANSKISQACLACARALCLDCPPDNPSCDPCTVQPWLCEEVPGDTSAEGYACICTESCAKECGESVVCTNALSSAGGHESGGASGNDNSGGMGNQAGGGNLPAENCFNGVDDNSNAQIDCEEESCAVACADPCAAPVLLELSEKEPVKTHTGSWKGHANVFTQDCAPSVKTGPDIVYSIRNSSQKDAFVRVSAGSTTGDVVLARKQSCSGGSQDIPCRNAVGTGGTESLEVLVAADSSLTVVVGAATAGAADAFSLKAELVVPVCGDGVVTPDEGCDDPNDPGCSKACQIIACDDAAPISDGETSSVSQKDGKVSSSLQASCSKLGATAGEYIHAIRAKHSGWLQAVLRSGDATDLTLSLWVSCQAGAELACSDAAPGAIGALERLVIPVSSGELSFAVVDSYDGNPVADYQLFARTYPAECGDGIVSPVEQCDGGETCDGDCTTKLAKIDEVEPNESVAQATPIPPGAFAQKKASLGGKIAHAGDSDLFLLTVEQGGLLAISTDEPGDGSCKRQGFSEPPVGLLDSELRLLTPEGDLIASNDNSPGDGFCSRIQIKVTPGTYLIQVRASRAAPAQIFSYLLKIDIP